MSSYIYYETLLFFQSVLMGAVLLLCYGLLGAFRKAVVHCPAAIACEDLLYWICTGFGVFAGIYRSNQGILRNFLFLGVILGVWLCHLTVYPLFERVWSYLFRIPVFFVKFSTKRLLFLVRRCKIFVYKFVNPHKQWNRLRIMRTKRSRQIGKVKKKDEQNKNSE